MNLYKPLLTAKKLNLHRSTFFASTTHNSHTGHLSISEHTPRCCVYQDNSDSQHVFSRVALQRWNDTSGNTFYIFAVHKLYNENFLCIHLIFCFFRSFYIACCVQYVVHDILRATIEQAMKTTFLQIRIRSFIQVL